MIPEYIVTLRQPSSNRTATHLELVYRNLSSVIKPEIGKKILIECKANKIFGQQQQRTSVVKPTPSQVDSAEQDHVTVRQ
jgi:hypothetical protein